VICEKPMAVSVDEADAMIRTAATHKRRLFGILNQRFMPIHATAKQVLMEGAIGRPMMMISQIFGNELGRFADPNHWKGDRKLAGGGVLIDSGIHHLDLMRFFLGDIASVSAVFKKLVVKAENKGEDNAFVTMEFANGTVGTLMTSYTMTEQPWTEPKAIYGSEGALVIDDSRPEPVMLVKAGPKSKHPDGCTRCDTTVATAVPIECASDETPWFYSIRQCINDFVEALIHDRQPQITAEDGREALAAALAAEASDRLGRRVTL